MEKHVRFIQVFSISSFSSDSNGYVSNIDNEVYSVGTETGKSVALTSKPTQQGGWGCWVKMGISHQWWRKALYEHPATKGKHIYI